MHCRFCFRSFVGIDTGNMLSAKLRQGWRTHDKNSRVCLHLLIDSLPVSDDTASASKIMHGATGRTCLPVEVGAGHTTVMWYLRVSHIAFSFFAAAAIKDRRAEGPAMKFAGSATMKQHTGSSGIGGDLEGWLTRSGIVLAIDGPETILPMSCCMLGAGLAATTLRKAGLQGMARVQCTGHHADRRLLQSQGTGLLCVSSR